MKVVFNSVSSALAEADEKDKEIEESLSMFGRKGKGKGKKGYRTVTNPDGSDSDEYEEEEYSFGDVRDEFIQKNSSEYDDRLLQIIGYELRPSGPKAKYRMFNNEQKDKLIALMQETLDNVTKVIDDASDKASEITKRKMS